MATTAVPLIGGFSNGNANPNDTLTFKTGDHGRVIQFWFHVEGSDELEIQFDGDTSTNGTLTLPGGTTYTVKVRVYSQVRMFQASGTPDHTVNWVVQ